jgi:hypothetical protein
MFATKADFEETVFLLAVNIFMFWCVYMFLEMCKPKSQKQLDDEDEEWKRNRWRREYKNTNMFSACAKHEFKLKRP